MDKVGGITLQYSFQSPLHGESDIPLPSWFGESVQVIRPPHFLCFPAQEIAAHALNKSLYEIAVFRLGGTELVQATKHITLWNARTVRFFLCKYLTELSSFESFSRAVGASLQYLEGSLSAVELQKQHDGFKNRVARLCTAPDTEIRGAVSSIYSMLDNENKNRYADILCHTLNIT